MTLLHALQFIIPGHFFSRHFPFPLSNYLSSFNVDVIELREIGDFCVGL